MTSLLAHIGDASTRNGSPDDRYRLYEKCTDAKSCPNTNGPHSSSERLEEVEGGSSSDLSNLLETDGCPSGYHDPDSWSRREKLG